MSLSIIHNVFIIIFSVTIMMICMESTKSYHSNILGELNSLYRKKTETNEWTSTGVLAEIYNDISDNDLSVKIYLMFDTLGKICNYDEYITDRNIKNLCVHYYIELETLKNIQSHQSNTKPKEEVVQALNDISKSIEWAIIDINSNISTKIAEKERALSFLTRIITSFNICFAIFSMLLSIIK